MSEDQVVAPHLWNERNKQRPQNPQSTRLSGLFINIVDVDIAGQYSCCCLACDVSFKSRVKRLVIRAFSSFSSKTINVSMFLFLYRSSVIPHYLGFHLAVTITFCLCY